MLLQALMLWPGTESRHLGYVFTQGDSIYIHTYLVDAARAQADLLSHTGSEPAPSTGMATARLLSYMTAKGIEIVEKDLPRGQRRLLTKRKLPEPLAHHPGLAHHPPQRRRRGHRARPRR